MKFKQFKLILESDKKEDKDPHPMFKDMSHYRKQIESEDEIIKLIKEKCDVKNYLYRGFEDDGDYYIIDGSKGKRVSKNTSNYYTVIIDEIFKSGTSYKDYPLRSESIICSTSKTTAGHYGNVYVVLPFKGVDIGYIGTDDIWRTDIEIGEYEFKIQEWNRVFEAMDISDNNFYSILNELVRDHTDGLSAIQEDVQENYHNTHEDDDDYDEDYEVSEDDIEMFIDESEELYDINLSDCDSIVESLEDQGTHRITKYIVLAKMFGLEEVSRDEIEKLVRNTYDPYDLGFELIKTEKLHSETDHDDIECWFGDKCVAISIDKWDEIKKKV